VEWQWQNKAVSGHCFLVTRNDAEVEQLQATSSAALVHHLSPLPLLHTSASRYSPPTIPKMKNPTFHSFLQVSFIIRKRTRKRLHKQGSGQDWLLIMVLKASSEKQSFTHDEWKNEPTHIKQYFETWNKEMHHYRDLTGSHAKKYFVYQYREHSQHVSLTRYVFAPDLKESRCEVVGLADDRINSSSLVFTDQSWIKLLHFCSSMIYDAGAGVCRCPERFASSPRFFIAS